MQKFLSKSFLIIFLLSLLSSFSYSLKAQDSEITEGREYWFGLPYCKMLQHENLRGDIPPIAIWVSSKFDTKVRMTIPEIGLIKNYVVRSNQITEIALDDQLMARESEVITNNGIHLLAEDPISVCVYYSYEWTGEAFRVIPVDWLGKKYVTLNMYLDQIDEMKPPQILVVATEDNTSVTYYPTKPTEKVRPGQSKTINLMKGQTYLILGEMNSAYVQDWDSDITGTYITSTKPIAVFSGHTKGAFPRYYVGYKSGYTDPYALFARNMLIEQMWPIELLGKEYVTAPIKYHNRPRGLSGVADDFGDLIRFVATEDNTVIYQMRQDGSGMMQISVSLKRGDYHDITNQEVAAYYRATKPVLVGHYGKTWWNEPGMMSVVEKKDDDPQNPHLSGQGMLLTVAPIERWCTYANFRSPPGIDDFIYLTFREADREKIYYDGEKINSLWSTSITEITGTPYAYVATAIQAGDHYIEGKDGARWAAYAYGNWDRTKDGFAFGYPIGINYADICPDSIYVEDVMDCGNVDGEFFSLDLDPDTTCAAIFSINHKEAVNYNFKLDDDFKSGDQTAKFTITIIDEKLPARIVVTAMTRSGKKLQKIYEYTPETIEADPVLVDFGLLPLNESDCQNITITNNSEVPVTIKELKLKNNRPEFVITSIDLPLTLMPAETKLIEVCATSLSLTSVTIRDSIIAVLSCYEQPIVELVLKTGEPSLWIADANWGQVPVNVEKAQNIEMKNESTVDVEIYSITWTDHTHFTRVEGLNFPFTIPAGGTYEFRAYYKTDVPGVQHRDSAYFETNAKKTKLYSIWNGIGIEAGPAITGFNWQKKRVIDEYAGVTEYNATVKISNTGNTNLNVNGISIANDPDGVFRYNAAQVPTYLEPGEDKAVDIEVYFAPNAEKAFVSDIILSTTFNNQEKTAQNMLEGIGILPHVEVTGYDFGAPILVGTSLGANGIVAHLTIDELTAMKLTVFDIRIEGEDKDAFVIDPTWYAAQGFPNKIIEIGSSIDVPITFTAQKIGEHRATLVADCDAPKTDKYFDDLIGRGFTEGLYTTDYNYDKIFVYTTKNGSVYLQNMGSDIIQIIRDIQDSKIGNAVDFDEFTITRWYTEIGGLENPAAPFDLGPGDRLIVEATFAPIEVRDEAPHTIKIEYVTSIGDTAYSNLEGIAMLINTVAEIPKGYRTNPGDKVTMDFKYYKNNNEPKPISQAEITSFTARVYFNSDDAQAYDIYPDLNNGCADIIKDGTMTASWTCNKAEIIDRKILEVSMSGTTPLAAGSNDVLFKFRMNTFLSSNDGDIKTIPCGFTRQFRYMEVDTFPGDISIAPVCVNTLRLIKLSGVDYSITQNNPNPAANMTSIDYSIGLEANTTIKLYNSNGEVVATFVDQLLKPGNYTLDINIEQLGLSSGVYYYRIESGPYSDTKSLVITK